MGLVKEKLDHAIRPVLLDVLHQPAARAIRARANADVHWPLRFWFLDHQIPRNPVSEQDVQPTVPTYSEG